MIKYRYKYKIKKVTFMKKKILLLILLPIVFLTLPTTCNAEEVPTLKWEDITTNFNDGMYLGDKQ